MDKENNKVPSEEIIEEEYMLGNEYYNKLLAKAKEEAKKYN